VIRRLLFANATAGPRHRCSPRACGISPIFQTPRTVHARTCHRCRNVRAAGEDQLVPMLPLSATLPFFSTTIRPTSFRGSKVYV